MNKKAIILLSGGMDSTTVLSIAKQEGYELYAMSFDYGQKHKIEMEMAKYNAKKFNVKQHIIVKTNLNEVTQSYLLGTTDKIEFHNVPNTVVPGRNMIFLSYAASWAEVLKAEKIFIGVSEEDYSGYVDCREEFIKSMEETINKGITPAVYGEMKIEIITPLMHMKKSNELKIGLKNGVDYSKTWTCYNPQKVIDSNTDEEKYIACGECPSCKLRIKAFKEIGMEDPLEYKRR